MAYFNNQRDCAVPLLLRLCRTFLSQIPPKPSGLQSPKAQVTEQHTVQPRSAAFLPSDPTQNWQLYRLLGKWVRAACPNMGDVASKIQKGLPNISFLPCDRLQGNKNSLLRREILTLPGSLDPYKCHPFSKPLKFHAVYFLSSGPKASRCLILPAPQAH